jgi:uncharacterized protein YecT (DUF1311 family)
MRGQIVHGGGNRPKGEKMGFTRAGFALIAALGLGGQAIAQSAHCDDATTTAEMSACAQNAYDEADAVLNAAYQSAMAVMKAIDADLPAARRGAADALKRAQRAWIAVRDGTCTAEGYLWEGGTGQGAAVLLCLATETQARADVLAGLAAYE